MLHILYGEDSFSICQALEQIKAKLGDLEILALNTTRLDGSHLTLNELRNSCSVVPFLAQHRLVIVEGLLGRFESGKKESRPRKSSRKETSRGRSELKEWEESASYVEQMPSSTALILVENGIKRNNPLLKKLSPLAEVKGFPLLKSYKLREWIGHRVSTAGGNIAPEATNLLVGLIGGDLWTMNNEIQKLLLYSQGRIVNEEDVTRLVSYARETSIFALVDAVVEGRLGVAQKVLHQLYLEGDSSTHILAMITRQFRLIALANDLEPGLSLSQIQHRLGLSPGYALEKTMAQARRYSLQGVKRAYDKLLETDLAIKTGKYGSDDQLALEFLVTELCAPSI